MTTNRIFTTAIRQTINTYTDYILVIDKTVSATEILSLTKV